MTRAKAIDAAIMGAAVKAKPATEVVEIQLGDTGRVITVSYPSDLTDPELLDLAGFVVAPLRGRIQEIRRGRGRLIVPS